MSMAARYWLIPAFGGDRPQDIELTHRWCEIERQSRPWYDLRTLKCPSHHRPYALCRAEKETIPG